MLTVDVEEWYHNCWVREYVDPAQRAQLPEELDRLLPELLDRLDRASRRATFFVLGEVARRVPGRIREISEQGHEVACHDELHLRVGESSVEAFRDRVSACKAYLEDLTGRAVVGYRSPEWSMRRLDNPRLPVLAEVGFLYDSSLSPAAGAGGSRNPVYPSLLSWSGSRTLHEIPPLTWGGALRIPAGGWSGRLAGVSVLVRAAERSLADGRVPLFVVHPWELTDRACPGFYAGLARWFHDAGREGFAEHFDGVLDRLEFRSTLAEVVSSLSLASHDA